MARGVRDIDRGWRKIAAAVHKAGNPKVRVGIQGKEAEETREGQPGVTNVLVATVHEFGSPERGIPERSFMRSTFDDKQRDYEKMAQDVARRFYDGQMTAERLSGELLLLGEGYRKDIITHIKSKIPPPLKPETIRRKGGEDTPLIDTGQMMNAIRAVKDEGSGE